jgi:UPF0755 protein
VSVSDLSIFGVDYDEGPTRAQRRRHQRRRRRRNPLGPLLGVLLIIVLVGGIVYGGRQIFGKLSEVPDYAGEGAGVVTVQVKSGDTATDIATTLVKLGVVKSERAFRDAAKDDPRSPSIQPGFYRLRKQMSGAAALTLLLDPAARVQSKLTVPEGLSSVETLKLISTKTATPLAQLQAAAKNTGALGLPAYAGGHLEGFLFPATYDIDPGTPAVQILKTLVATYKENVDDSGLSARAGVLGITPYELLTVASLVEEEAITPDFGKVARVIYNRVGSGQRLELDSTVNYALHRNRIRVSAQDLEVASPYNTYRRAGLPPTPISNPGVGAIQAALHPTPGPWVYFVKADKAGHSYFTASYQDFQQAKQRAQAAGVF